jgi:hypothetical protein
MRFIAGISGIVFALSVCALDGGALLVAAPAAAVSLALLFFSCGRLGCFTDVTSRERCERARVLAFPNPPPTAGRGELRGSAARHCGASSMNSTVQSSVSM